MLTFFSSATRNSILSKTLKFPTPEYLISHFHSISRVSNPAIQFILEEAEEDFPSSREPIQSSPFGNGEIPRSRESGSGVQISHPWPEWIDLMKKLLKNGYFSGDGNPFPRNNESGIKDSNQIRTACLNFARDQFDLVRHMSRKDIQVISEAGCPSIDRKVVNSGKRLRAYLGIDEGNVCSSCILRGNCERAYIKAREDEGIGRTVDVMRFLLTYGLDPTCGSVENKSHMNKRLEESVRKLLKEMVELSINEGGDYESQDASSVVRSSTQGIAENHKDSTVNGPMKPGDWLCTNCNFLNFARNIKCLRCNGISQERLHNLRSEQDNLPLKKGDWICDKCNFLNFAKNTRCLQCKETPPKRALHPGEWECESCNYINFKRNMVCLKCDHRRPRASNSIGSSLHACPNTNNRLSSSPYLDREKQFRDGVNEPNAFKSHRHEFVSRNQEAEFADFPILGGKSDISRNEQKREKWKRETMERSTTAVKSKEEDFEFKSSFVETSNHSQFPNHDDEQMADWFGHKTIQNDKRFSP
ncbi:unnamed protein product [Cuscuta epithymum]|uniref:RanBP2-type domain-containing protein n=1 Tax=Cuscuta epithymum TaxID=186058 RepID=A0AAV0DUL7_9ASTE|nr:unnamed protein product [Cuscuta epithymum]